MTSRPPSVNDDDRLTACAALRVWSPRLLQRSAASRSAPHHCTLKAGRAAGARRGASPCQHGGHVTRAQAAQWREPSTQAAQVWRSDSESAPGRPAPAGSTAVDCTVPRA